MSVDTPSPGELVKTVAELVTVINSGGVTFPITSPDTLTSLDLNDSGITLDSPSGIVISASGPGAVGLFYDGTSEVLVDTNGVAIVGTNVTVNGSPIGGGGGFSDFLQISDDQSIVTLSDGSPVTFHWDPTIVGGAYYRTNGSAITWSNTHDTRLTIATTGYYDFDVSLAVGGGASDCYALVGFSINGTPNTYPLVSQTPILASSPAVAIQSRFKRISLSATDYVEVYAIAVGDTPSVEVCQVIATRVA